MGAHDFQDLAFGKNAAEAYRAAIDAALHEFGHNGYNGTISTTNGVVEIHIPKGWTSDEWATLIWWVREQPTDERLRHNGWSSWNAQPRRRVATLPTLPTRRKFSSEWDRKHYQQQRAILTKAKRLVHEDLVALALAADSINKWETCVCWKSPAKEEREHRARHPYLKGRRGAHYEFIGIASC